MLDPQLHTLGEQMFFLLSPYMEKEQAEKLSSQILLLLLEDRKSIYDLIIHHCDRTDLRTLEKFQKYNDNPIANNFIRGSEHVTEFFRYVANNRINIDKDYTIEILKTMK